MAQQLANTQSVVVLSGRKDSIEKVYEALTDKKPRINPLTGKAFTKFSGLNFRRNFGFRGLGWSATCVVSRMKIKGNWQNDISEIFNNAIAAANVDVKYQLVRFDRKTV